MSSIIELCDRVIWIDNGKIKKTGAASDVVRDYLKSLDVTYELPEMGVEEIIQESRSTDDKNVPQKIKQSSWWDSPVVDMNEKIITGNGFRDLYDYLKTGLGFNGLSCLGALNRLTHCKDELIRTGICRSFKAIDVDDIYMEMPDSYDLFIAIDVFKKRQDILGIIEKIKELLRDDGIFIALDALRGHPYLPKEKEISTKILRYIGLDMEIEEINGPMNGKVRNNLDEIIGRLFEIIDVRYFGSSLYDLVIDRLLNSDRADKDALIELIVGLDQIMLKEGTLRGKYGLIVAKKRRGYQGKRGGDTELQEEPL
jgi:SAM-dependent methyltransferase